MYFFSLLGWNFGLTRFIFLFQTFLNVCAFTHFWSFDQSNNYNNINKLCRYHWLVLMQWLEEHLWSMSLRMTLERVGSCLDYFTIHLWLTLFALWWHPGYKPLQHQLCYLSNLASNYKLLLVLAYKLFLIPLCSLQPWEKSVSRVRREGHGTQGLKLTL